MLGGVRLVGKGLVGPMGCRQGYAGRLRSWCAGVLWPCWRELGGVELKLQGVYGNTVSTGCPSPKV
eukprot:1033934-Prorocentrum_minimum.AAC.1